MKKFIAPDSWFAFLYPDTWFEFNEEPDCFLFYNPERWEGNFRISAYRDASPSFGDRMMCDALKVSGARLQKVGRWETIYVADLFTEQLVEYITHRWTIGCGQTCVECSFTATADEHLGMPNALIASLEILHPRDTFRNQYIPVRVAEVELIESCYASVEELGMKLFKERFRDFDYNVRLLQKLVQRPELTKQFGADAGAVIGVVLCVFLTETIEGLEWKTYVHGKVEAPVLMYGDSCVARPMLLFGKQGELLGVADIPDIIEEIRARKEEAAAC